MRVVSLVRYWLYGFRGFVVMTISLALAFSWAVTGPPTNTELDLFTEAVATKAEVFGDEINTVAIQVCPSLPTELQVFCGGAPRPAVPEQAPVSEPPPKPPARVELAASDAVSVVDPGVADAQLLGGPAPRARAERAQSSRRAAPHRAETRRTVQRAQRAQLQRRATAQRASPQPRQEAARRQPASPPQAPVVREAERAPPVIRNSESEVELERAADAYRREADERRYLQQEEAEHEAWRQERRERREERRRRWEERQRAYEAAAEERYYEEEYPADGW